MKITFIFSCSGMFRDVTECSGMFHVPGFIDAPVRHCAGYDMTTIIGMYVAIKIKSPPLLWYKQSDIYEIFHGKYMVFNH